MPPDIYTHHYSPDKIAMYTLLTINTYAQNAFTRDEQVRLSNYLLHECKARWMLIIKYTDFIYSLYQKPGISLP